jgi:hypothetical protein
MVYTDIPLWKVLCGQVGLSIAVLDNHLLEIYQAHKQITDSEESLVKTTQKFLTYLITEALSPMITVRVLNNFL